MNLGTDAGGKDERGVDGSNRKGTRARDTSKAHHNGGRVDQVRLGKEDAADGAVGKLQKGWKNKATHGSGCVPI